MSFLFEHPRPLIPGRLVDRYQRFIAVVRLDSGEEVRAHCVNPGRMEGVVVPESRVFLSKAPPEKKRKLKYTWELTELEGRLWGANTVMPNDIAGALLEQRLLAGLKGFRSLRREVRYGEKSRVDFLLEDARGQHFVEVKNCHLVYPDGRGYFPDSQTKRGAEHLRHLAEEVRKGHRATVLFTALVPEVEALRPSALHDPAFFEAARDAAEVGVKFRAVHLRPSLKGFELIREVPVQLRRYDPATLESWREANASSSGWRRLPKES